MSHYDDRQLTPEEERQMLRFYAGAKTITEVLESSGRDWLIEGWLASSATMVDGSPESGKSSMVASMAAVVAGNGMWLDVPVTTDRTGPVVVITSDPSDAGQWAKKGRDLGVSDDDWALVSFSSERWGWYEDLADGLRARLLVFDNITSGLEGPINEADPSSLLGPLGRIVEAGTPVVAIAHSGKGSGAGPMGPTAYKAWRRHGLHVSGFGEQRTITRHGNLGSWSNVVVRGNTEGTAVQYSLADDQPGQKRSPDRLDENAAIADWVVANCQGKGVNAVGRQVAAEFGGTEGSRKTSLKSGALSKMLNREGEGGSTSWSAAK